SSTAPAAGVERIRLAWAAAGRTSQSRSASASSPERNRDTRRFMILLHWEQLFRFGRELDADKRGQMRIPVSLSAFVCVRLRPCPSGGRHLDRESDRWAQERRNGAIG